ncbi:kinase-like domain-containing protein [Rhizophagus irregularis DAOM 181602=DAOM 197198]|uniref:Kinase-like domain-containing protein n=1 Tax=Rhizophagus irregularis (strain DAOM 181602 / DAOM 197198 / MUCL 43194) TaxID=747089 RepID=A0A2P4QN59_RHIID|nr:kinase-like domain-containing protein [Rhizophagus irregularis DAOM 181602=DAOM 197198]POG79076.1 kinase-like domain-containing protein [Rhizophagus irregularis DAOM 181602=DAOM 197198]|eukprot:XP_025185942.1 kinase-like domain-containing protein [Rhizophagus irregularis DAOM 181602=DAOM 197198]
MSKWFCLKKKSKKRAKAKSADTITSITPSRSNDTEKLNLTEERLKLCADEINTFSFEEKPINIKVEDSNTTSTSIPSSFASDLKKLNITEERLKRYADEANTLSSDTTITSNTENELKTKVTFLREKAISKTLNNIKLSMKVDLCFVLDCTDSMEPFIAAARDCIIQVTNYIKHTNPSIELRVGFCGYRDHCDGDGRLQFLDFTDKYEQFITYMQSVFHYGGGDAPEDVLGGLNEAITKMDWKNGTRVLLHIGDYPPHGTKFTDLSDSYPNGDPHGLTAENVLEKMQSKNILYFFGKITDYTEIMLQIFRGIIATSTSITYAVSMTSTIGSDSKYLYSFQRKKLDMNPNEPDWIILPLQEGIVMWYPILDTLDELKDPNYFNKSNLFSRSFSFKIASQPFSAGAEKYAYFGLDIERNPAKKMVIKEYLHIGRNDSFEKYIEAVEISTIASFLSTEFNLITERKDLPKVKFLNVKLLRCGTIDFSTRYYTIEPKFHNIEYKRFNANTGVITELRPILEAFVHFTYEYTKGYLVVCDLQGIELTNEFLLTDPAIHCVDSLRFGRTNFGKEGINQLFLANHRCNDICKQLKLKHISNGLSEDVA